MSEDDVLDQLIDSFVSKRYEHGWNEATWRDEVEQHPLFRTSQFGDDETLPPLYEGLQQVKYESTDGADDSLALTYKLDGDHYYRKRDYDRARAEYTKGVATCQQDRSLLTDLLANRAAAHLQLCNWRSARLDCERVLKLHPAHEKCRLRLLQCLQRLDAPASQQLQTCLDGVSLCPHSESLRTMYVRLSADSGRSQCERRRVEAERRRLAAESERLLHVLNTERVFRVRDSDDDIVLSKDVNMDHLQPSMEGVSTGVHLDACSRLVWPLVLVYPEHAVLDVVQEVCESDCVHTHLHHVLQTQAAWDSAHDYRASTSGLYYEGEGRSLVRVGRPWTLGEVIAMQDFVVGCGGVVSLVVLCDNTFGRRYLQRYS